MKDFIVFYLIFINITAFILCLWDKKAAVKHAWRISEKTLMFFSAIGGATGFYLSMQLFRHKTKHALFTIGVPVIITLHIALGVYALNNWL